MDKIMGRFIRELEEAEVCLHSVALIYRGKVIGERYFGPFGPHTLQRMFSVSKSFVSVAVGLLCEEGRIGLSDPILQYFPEYAPDIIPPQLARMTIRDMLRMQTCYDKTTYKRDPGQPWVPSFFHTQPHHEPGMVFMYDTSSSHTLCALVEKLSGKEIMEYLREKCLDEIGFSKEAYFIRNEFNEAMGGSGLMAKTGDMIKFARLLMEGGVFRGKQLLPKGYMKQAVSFQTPTRMRGAVKEERPGYGYQFWRLTHHGFGCYGKGGQLVLCYPDHDLAVITTADTTSLPEGNQAIYDSLYRNIFPALSSRGHSGNPSRGSDGPCPGGLSCGDTLAGYRGRSCAGRGSSEDAGAGGMTWSGECPGDFLSANARSKDAKEAGSDLWGKEYWCEDAGVWKKIVFFSDRICFCTGDEVYELPVGWETARPGSFPQYNDACVTKAEWLDFCSLYIRSDMLGENMAIFEMQAVFKGAGLLCYMKHTQEFRFEEFAGIWEGKLKKK